MGVEMKLCNYFFIVLLTSTQVLYSIPHYYCIAADTAHYHLLKNLIGSIHHVDFEHLGEIAVFDLGFTEQEKQELATMQKVTVHDVEMANSELLTYHTTSPNGRSVRGSFSWKPVVIKQALELFPYVLYLDAGTTVLKPLDDLFEYIHNSGYFLLSCSKVPQCNVPNRLTTPVISMLLTARQPQERVCAFDEHTYMIDAGLQGLSRQLMSDYVLPMYYCAHNIQLFKDDGSAPFGYGAGRHDQTLFTLFAHWLKLTIHDEGFNFLNLGIEGKLIHIDWNRANINKHTIIYRSRGDYMFNGGMTQYIRFK